MAEYTQNYNLKKPAEEDFYNVKDFNDNADIIDQALKAHDDALATKETPAGAQAKAEAAAGAVQAELDAHLAETVKNNVHGLKTTGNVTIYVDAVNGNNANPGTQSQPLKTIKAAIDKVTSLVISHIVTIQLAPGTYVEGNINISNLQGSGAFYIRGGNNLSEADNYVIDGRLTISGCTCLIHVFGVKVLGTSDGESAIKFERCLAGGVYYCKIDKTGKIPPTNNYGIEAGQYSNIIVLNCDISNVAEASGANAALQCFETSRLFSGNNTGTNNSIGLRCVSGTIMKFSTQPSGVTAEATLAGGVIR